ncbi:tail fiber domain-containing protein [Longimicrobium sp.]|uniref:tail fiber domain-containing protein n=1 Tax=Longimicrobium sp. TaxID=2029185 RepID=UPI003B3A8564
MKRTMLRHTLMVAAGVLAFAAPALAQTPDSAFAVSSGGMGLYRVNVDGGALWGGVYDGDGDGSNIPVEGAGTRMMWYPGKGAFRAGGINGTQWDAALIGDYSVAMGQDVRASASHATAFGLRTAALQQSAFAAGEDNTASGAASVALGYHAHTNARQGAFVFSDRSSVDTLRAGVNHSANWRVSGGFRIFTSSNQSTGVTFQSGASVSNWGHANAVISTSTGAILTTGGVWQNSSDVNRKHRFAQVSGEDVLARLRALPITSWTYKVESDEVRHLGPTAQDFRAAFGLGTDELSIGTVDADGVALVAAQALERRTTEQDARIEALEARNAALQQENAEMRARLERIEAMLAGGQQP